MSNSRMVDPRPHTDADGGTTSERQTALLMQWVARYIWWKPVPDAMRYPGRIIAQVMNIGDYDDVQALVERFGAEALRDVVRHAEAGQFNARSWAYWHYRLGLISSNAQARVPPLPARSVL